MTPSEVFGIVGMMAMPMWILMILLPKWKVTRFLIVYKVIPILLSIVYLIYVTQSISTNGMMDFSSLDSVMTIFTDEVSTLAGWVHYLAFDLLVGMWMINQNRKLNIHQIIMAPCLFLTFMLGPVGFILFIIIRSVKGINPNASIKTEIQ